MTRFFFRIHDGCFVAGGTMASIASYASAALLPSSDTAAIIASLAAAFAAIATGILAIVKTYIALRARDEHRHGK
jgi:hypothetical protein